MSRQFTLYHLGRPDRRYSSFVLKCCIPVFWRAVIPFETNHTLPQGSGQGLESDEEFIEPAISPRDDRRVAILITNGNVPFSMIRFASQVVNIETKRSGPFCHAHAG
jgi:hypothetical protein